MDDMCLFDPLAMPHVLKQIPYHIQVITVSCLNYVKKCVLELRRSNSLVLSYLQRGISRSDIHNILESTNINISLDVFKYDHNCTKVRVKNPNRKD